MGKLNSRRRERLETHPLDHSGTRAWKMQLEAVGWYISGTGCTTVVVNVADLKLGRFGRSRLGRMRRLIWRRDLCEHRPRPTPSARAGLALMRGLMSGRHAVPPPVTGLLAATRLLPGPYIGIVGLASPRISLACPAGPVPARPTPRCSLRRGELPHPTYAPPPRRRALPWSSFQPGVRSIVRAVGLPPAWKDSPWAAEGAGPSGGSSLHSPGGMLTC